MTIMGTASMKTKPRNSRDIAHRREMAGRKKARAKLKKEGKVKAGQDVHHKNGNPTDNRRSNIEATSRKYNRSRNKK